MGASTGYGLASRIALAFGGQANTVGVFLERSPGQGRTATAGWYNSLEFERIARSRGLFALSVNGDAFSDATKAVVSDVIANHLGHVDALIYSLASPRRTHPETGRVRRSVLKPIGRSYATKTLNVQAGQVGTATIDAATNEEIESTVDVMGGDDWVRWVGYLFDRRLLASNFTTIAYSYVGPEVTWPIYSKGTIGCAKEDLERSAACLQEVLRPVAGQAFVAMLQAQVTQSSSAIPAIPLYLSLLYRVMKNAGTFESTIQNVHRLYSEKVFNPNTRNSVDDGIRIRVDQGELADKVQTEIARLWDEVDTCSLSDLTDIEGYRADFLRLFGFGLSGVHYGLPVDLLEGRDDSFLRPT